MVRTFVVLPAILALSACAGDPAKVSKGDLAKVQQASRETRVGMPRDEALAAYPKGNKTRLSTSVVGGVAVEEWKVEAYHDDDWSKTRSLFVNFLYFADDTLVDISDTRIDYRADPAIVQQWAGGGGG